MMSEKQKILLCGDVEGRFDVLFKRIENINKKSGHFDMMLCVGNFFGINNKEIIPYKIGDKKSKRGIYTDSKGLKIAYISGISHKEDCSKLWTYSEKEVKEMCDNCLKGNASFRGVDILLSSQWPSNIIAEGSKEVTLSVNCSSDLPSYLCMKLKPRYIASGLEGIYYERSPFRCPNLGDHDTTLETVTRFIGLARVGNTNKDKWIYALNLSPLCDMKLGELLQKTTDETPCPFDFYDLESKIFKNVGKRSGPSQYFYDMDKTEGDAIKRKKAKKFKMEFDQSKCWFCLASPSVEKHLIISVGTTAYLALAKGGMVEEHLLICPIEHYQSTICQPLEVLKEINQYKEALREFYRRNNKVPVFFERNYKTSHMQLQAIPIPKNANRELKDIFMEESESQGFKLEPLDTHNRLDQVIPTKVPYFTVDLPDSTLLYTKIQGSTNFPLNFAREVLASGPVLNLPDRIDWKDCILQKDEEEKLIQRLRTDFEPYDFTL